MTGENAGYTLYDYLPSGNGYKVRLTLRHLGLPYELVEVDILKGGTRTPEFLALNPIGRIPALKLPDGVFLAESHAIIWYLAESSVLMPASRLERARVLSWLSFEQYELEPNVATVRFWLALLHKQPAELGEKLTEKQEKGNRALAVLDEALKGKPFLVGSRFSLADISLYAYTHVAGEGGFDLKHYPNVLAWLKRVAALPNHSPITAR
ncbi:MAG TPA: glutathione S-transferase family protein [Steroidobacteraceae bacterium]|nr:glutathione S-transferase family protein [Steroidobacteraceae bacterium]